jgi:hypothetical protein
VSACASVGGIPVTLRGLTSIYQHAVSFLLPPLFVKNLIKLLWCYVKKYLTPPHFISTLYNMFELLLFINGGRRKDSIPHVMIAHEKYLEINDLKIPAELVMVRSGPQTREAF